MLNNILLFANLFGTNASSTSEGGNSSPWGTLIMVAWIAIFFVIMYFLMIRPQRKEAKKKEMMLSDAAVGDTVLTTSGFYGTIIDLSEDTVIVEFGNNKNCRIPMQRDAIAAIEKPEEASADN